MVRRQTYRKGPPTSDEYDAIFDSGPAEQMPYYNKRYESHLYQTEQEKAQEIFRLLRALSEHLDAQDRKRARHRHLRPRDTGDETTDQQNGPTLPPLLVGTDQSKGTRTTIGELSSPGRRPTTAENSQPKTNIPAPNTTTSETSHKPRKQNTLAHRDVYSELTPTQKNHDQEHTTPTRGSKVNQATVPNHINPANGHQTEVPRHETQVIGVNPGDVVTTTQVAEPMKSPRPPRTRDPTPDKDREHFEHTSRDLAIPTNRRSSTPLNLSASSSEGSYETYPHWQPIDTNTLNPGTEPVTNYAADKSSSTPNWREPFTGRDTRVIPDRGKSFRRN